MRQLMSATITPMGRRSSPFCQFLAICLLALLGRMTSAYDLDPDSHGAKTNISPMVVLPANES